MQRVRRRPRRAGRRGPSRGAPGSRRARPRRRATSASSPWPVVTTKAPTWSPGFASCGATKSASARHRADASRTPCWRSVWKTAASPPPPYTSMSSPTLAAGKMPATPRAASRRRSRTIRSRRRPGVVVELPRLRAEPRVGQDRRVAAVELPGLEERRPVDEGDELGERERVERAHAGERRRLARHGGPVAAQGAGPRLGERDDAARAPRARDARRAGAPGRRAPRRDVGRAVGRRRRGERRHHLDGPRGVEHVDDGAPRGARARSAPQCGPRSSSPRRSAAAGRSRGPPSPPRRAPSPRATA